jgi:hypothetical protein
VNLEAVSRFAVIEIGAVRLLWSLRVEVRDTVASNVRALVGAAGDADSDSQAFILAELQRWRHWAATLTGWVTPPFRPHVPCPVCDQRRLVINLDRKKAYCANLGCNSLWDDADGSIFVLADHIRTWTDAA